MSVIKFFAEITKNNVSEAGGKGASLGEMTQAGLQVPPGFVILANTFDRFIQETGLQVEITAKLSEIDPQDLNKTEQISTWLRTKIENTPIPADLAEEIEQSFETLGAEFVAVRSSATAEDSSSASWAGELETYLNTTRESLLENVRKCWSSLFTARALFYRHEKNLITTHVSVAVVVQKMVQSEISGIAFTVHPVTEDKDQMIIEAGLGLGEAIVGGMITPDSYVISKNEKAILDITIGEQNKLLTKQGWSELGPKGNAQKLTGKQIIELSELCQKIEQHYGFPCDVEWAFADGEFYITQSRPITTLK